MKRLYFNNIGLRNKLLIIYIVSVFIPITLTHIIFYDVTTENVRTQKINDLSFAVEQMATEFRKGVDDAVGVSAVLYADSQLYDFIQTEYGSTLDFIQAYNSNYRNISKYVPIYSSIRSIGLYTDNDTVIFAGGINKIDGIVKKKKWYQESELQRNSFPVLVQKEGNSEKKAIFSIIRELNYYQKNTTQNILEIELNTRLLTEIFDNMTFPGEVYLLDEDNIIAYSTNSNIDWSTGNYNFDSVPINNDNVTFKEKYQLNYLENWKVVGVTSEDIFLHDVKGSRNLIIYLALINLIFPSLFIIYITSSLHLRILRILKHMRKVEDQNFELIDGVDYQDEIGELTKAFNRMAGKIKTLIKDVYLADIQKKDLALQRKKAQLSALQSQINPHFLFNVLETIRMRSILKKEDETAKIIKNMAEMLRNSFIWSRDWVTIKQEVYLIKCFLEIQYYRFDDKMKFQIEVSPEANDCYIPNMTLIPFVENASIHGIEALKGHGLIHIKVNIHEEQLICEISDNGVGMEEIVYDRIIKSLEEEENIGEHIGIKNVYYRLKLQYPDQFKFEFKSKKNFGTTIRIAIPIDRQQKM